MSQATCFVCLKQYGSDNPDDLAGDGRCADCEKMRKAVAIKVNAEIAQKRFHDRNDPVKIAARERAEKIKALAGGSDMFFKAAELGL